MDDPELEAIRQRRMQELIAQHGGAAAGGAGSGGAGAGQMTPEAAEERAQAAQAAEERRSAMLAQVLLPAARERLARIALVKPDKARGVEDLVLQAAQRGQIVERVSEERLITLLEQINAQGGGRAGPRVTIQRRRPVWEDEDG